MRRGLGWAGWAEVGCWLRLELGLGGLGCAVLGRVAGSASYTLRPEAGWQVAGWAGPEACRRHVRHASRRAEDQSHTAPKGLGLLDDLGPDASRRYQPGLSSGLRG